VFEHKASNVWRIAASMTTTGPAGPTGPTGPTGPQGTQGPAGTIGTVQNAGADMAQRSKLNFIGATVTDDAANNRTTVTVSGGGSSLVEGRAKSATLTAITMPGVTLVGGSSTFTCSPNRAQYLPRRVQTSITIDQILFEVTTAVASCNGRVAIYAATNDYQPTGAPLADTGAIDCSTTGIKTTTLATPLVLSPGLYLIWENYSTGNPVLRAAQVSWSFLGAGPSLGGNIAINQIYAAQTYGAPPTTPLAWDSVAYGAPALDHIWIRESVA
jgi:hypothetical protein